MGRPGGEHLPAHLAGRRDGLPLFGRRHAHDALCPFGGFAGGLCAHRPAKGLLEKLIINRHALKNSLLPVATIIGLEFAFLMGGLVVTEQVFNLNGLGKLFVESVTNHDYTMTQSLVMLVAVVFILTNLFIDILYAWLDPRIRYS